MRDDCIPGLAEQLSEWRRFFHRNPELSMQEKQTSLMIQKALSSMGVEVLTSTEHNGVCGIIHGGQPGPTVLFRADMDGLPITEANEAPYCSATPGVMHACGHDGHMAIALGLAQWFSASKFAGTVKILFQPAEEAAPVGGAELLMADGWLDEAAIIFGLHLWPDLPCGHIGVREGPFMAASDRFTIKILGQGAHAGQPHNGIDSIVIAADVIHGLGHIMNRQIDPLETATLSVGLIRGGERYNVIAREVELAGTVRTLSENVRNEIPAKMERLLSGITGAQGGDFSLDFRQGYPVLANWAEPTEILLDAARLTVGEDAIHSRIKPALASEDFSRYLTRMPGAYFWLGCMQEDKQQYPLHNPNFDMNENALLIGVKILYQAGMLAMEGMRRNRQGQHSA